MDIQRCHFLFLHYLFSGHEDEWIKELGCDRGDETLTRLMEVEVKADPGPAPTMS